MSHAMVSGTPGSHLNRLHRCEWRAGLACASLIFCLYFLVMGESSISRVTGFVGSVGSWVVV